MESAPKSDIQEDDIPNNSLDTRISEKKSGNSQVNKGYTLDEEKSIQEQLDAHIMSTYF